MPFNVNCEAVRSDLQLELIELQSNDNLKQSFLNMPKLEFYKSLSKVKTSNNAILILCPDPEIGKTCPRYTLPELTGVIQLCIVGGDNHLPPFPSPKFCLSVRQSAEACAPNLTFCQRKLLLTTQKKYLSFITGVYRTTPTAVLQSITGILTLYLKAEQEAVYVRAARLRRGEYFLGEAFIPEDFEAKDLYLGKHLTKFDLDNRFNLSPQSTDSKGLKIYRDGSKMESKASIATEALQDNTQLHK
ncbi:hypothetical protein AVEN_229775-1 [Araneus ventricosus]|uniref:Uncharacterized protein n=1 Tax=Araneus ventricosus TaxID=182803 RepID=A0A4Y2K5X3_ARAVE|nr:hypothetical protein AVEN_229775-1 [Araneus ventricosus]